MKSWYLDNVVELAEMYKYTFFVPHETVIARLKKGDIAQLRFMLKNPVGEQPESERMWVEIISIEGSSFNGILTNQPKYIEHLETGEQIEFESYHIMNTELKSDAPNLVEKYIHRCLASNEVIRDKKRVKYLFKNASKGELRDGIFDSGWIIMSGEEDQEYLDDANNISVVSLGAVLNIDDSIISLLEEPTGSEFEWDEDQKKFMRLK